MNSSSLTPHTVIPMQHLQAVQAVRDSKPLRFCFGEQESEPYQRTLMSDPPIVYKEKVFVTHYFSLGLKMLGPWVRNLAHLLCSSIYTIFRVHLTIYSAHFT